MARTTATARGMKDQSRSARISAVGVYIVGVGAADVGDDGDDVAQL